MISLSVIVVNYKVKRYLFGCLSSIKKYWPKFSIEILVVDNDEVKVIGNELKNKFPWVKYIKSSRNIGYGAGNNLGARYARGEFLFFVNPDTVFVTPVIDILVDYLKKNDKIGIVAPLLLNPVGDTYPLQGTSRLGFWQGMIALSFLNKIFPGNLISKKYWHLDWDKTKVREVDVVPGTAFVIRKELFEEIGGFDERFFMYFEEYDLCNRVKSKGYSLFILPKAKIIHTWGASSKSFKKNDYFIKSRFLYFKKYIGFLPALFFHIFISIRPLVLQRKIYSHFERLIKKLFFFSK